MTCRLVAAQHCNAAPSRLYPLLRGDLAFPHGDPVADRILLPIEVPDAALFRRPEPEEDVAFIPSVRGELDGRPSGDDHELAGIQFLDMLSAERRGLAPIVVEHDRLLAVAPGNVDARDRGPGDWPRELEVAGSVYFRPRQYPEILPLVAPRLLHVV